MATDISSLRLVQLQSNVSTGLQPTRHGDDPDSSGRPQGGLLHASRGLFCCPVAHSKHCVAFLWERTCAQRCRKIVRRQAGSHKSTDHPCASSAR